MYVLRLMVKTRSRKIQAYVVTTHAMFTLYTDRSSVEFKYTCHLPHNHAPPLLHALGPIVPYYHMPLQCQNIHTCPCTHTVHMALAGYIIVFSFVTKPGQTLEFLLWGTIVPLNFLVGYHCSIVASTLQPTVYASTWTLLSGMCNLLFGISSWYNHTSPSGVQNLVLVVGWS